MWMGLLEESFTELFADTGWVKLFSTSFLFLFFKYQGRALVTTTDTQGFGDAGLGKLFQTWTTLHQHVPLNISTLLKGPLLRHSPMSSSVLSIGSFSRQSLTMSLLIRGSEALSMSSSSSSSSESTAVSGSPLRSMSPASLSVALHRKKNRF